MSSLIWQRETFHSESIIPLQRKKFVSISLLLLLIQTTWRCIPFSKGLVYLHQSDGEGSFFSLKRPTTETSTLRIFNISFTGYNSVRSFTRNLWQVLNIRSIMKLNPHFSSMQCSECFWRSLIQCTFRLFVFMFSFWVVKEGRLQKFTVWHDNIFSD